MRRAVCTLIPLLTATVHTSILTASDDPFLFAGQRLTINTPMMQIGFEGGVIVYLKGQLSGEILVNSDPWTNRPSFTPSITQSAAATFQEVGPLQGQLDYTLSGGNHLLVEATIDERSGEVTLVLTETGSGLPASIDWGVLGFGGRSAILGNGAHYARTDEAYTDYGFTGGPNIGILEGTHSVASIWSEATNSLSTEYVKLYHTAAYDHLLLKTGVDPKQTDPRTMVSSPWRIGTYSTWVAAAKRWRERFEARTGARPLWENRATWVRNIHCVHYPNHTLFGAEYCSDLAQIVPPSKTLMFANLDRQVLFGDPRLVVGSIAFPTYDDLALIADYGWPLAIFYPWDLIYTEDYAATHLEYLESHGWLPEGYSFNPDYSGEPEDWYTYWSGVTIDLYDENKFYVIHPGATIFKTYLRSNYANFCDTHSLNACYFDTFGSDRNALFPAGKKVIDGLDYVGGEVSTIATIYISRPDLAVISEVQARWLLPHVFYSWEGTKQYLRRQREGTIYASRVNHPIRAALSASFCWARETNIAGEIDDRVSALLGTLPAVDMDGAYQVTDGRAAISRARAQLFCAEELFNDLPDSWDSGVLAYYRSERTGHWFRLVDNGTNLQYVEMLPGGSQTVRLEIPPARHSLVVIAMNGTVTKKPDQAGYASAQTVTLEAVPNDGFRFSGWSGDASGTSSPITIIMDTDRSVTATFAASSDALDLVATAGPSVPLTHSSRIWRIAGVPCAARLGSK